ncbi:MAG: DUF481 domain-containing protein [Planctomycetota bacterium]
MNKTGGSKSRTSKSLTLYLSKRLFRLYLLMWIVFSLFTPSLLCADTITLIQGDILNGKITKQNDTQIILEHKALGKLDIPRNQIKTVVLDKPDTKPPSEPEDQPQPQTTQPQKPEKPLHELDFHRLKPRISKWKKKGWGFSADISGDRSTGNTEEQAIRVGLGLKRTQPDARLGMDFSYYNKVSEGNVTDNKFSLGLLKDWLRPQSRLFYFVTGRFDYDEFESWQERASAHAGPGFHLVKKENFMLDLRLGAGSRKEWGSENDDIKPEGLAQLDLDWKITKKQSLTLSSAVFPVFSDFNDLRTRTTANWRFLFSEELNLSFLIGLLHEYQSIVDPGDDKNDLRLHTGLQFSF